MHNIICNLTTRTTGRYVSIFFYRHPRSGKNTAPYIEQIKRIELQIGEISTETTNCGSAFNQVWYRLTFPVGTYRYGHHWYVDTNTSNWTNFYLRYLFESFLIHTHTYSLIFPVSNLCWIRVNKNWVKITYKIIVVSFERGLKKLNNCKIRECGHPV